MTGWRDAVAAGLDVLRVVLGAGLLSVIVYRVYLNRPQRAVPVTDEEIATYKRTGRHMGGSGFSGYGIIYGERRGGLAALLLLGALVGLAGTVLSPRLAHLSGGARERWTLAGIFCALVGLYCAGFAGLLLHEVRTARRTRTRALLAALTLPPGARVLCVEHSLGLLGITAAEDPGVAAVTVLVADAPTLLEQTHINLRRANVPDRARAVDAVAADEMFTAVLLADRHDVAAWQGRALAGGLMDYGGPVPAGWQALPNPWPGWALGVLSFGELRPLGAIWLQAG